jgi:hypothetical protein
MRNYIHDTKKQANISQKNLYVGSVKCSTQWIVNKILTHNNFVQTIYFTNLMYHT